MSDDRLAAKAGSLGRRASIAASWLIVWRAISRALGIGSTIILARLLTPADFGIVTMAMSFEGAIQTFAQFPVHDALMRRREREPHLYDTAFTIQAIRAGLVGLLLAGGAVPAAAWFHEPKLTPLILVLAAGSLVNGFMNIGIVDVHRQLRFDIEVKISVLPSVLQILTTLGVAWFTHSYWALLAGLSVRRVVSVAMTYAVLPHRPRFSLHGWRDLIGFSFWLGLIGIVSTAWDRIDAFIVGPIFGPLGLGLYSLASQVGRLPISDLLEPAFAAMFASFASAERGGESGNALRRSAAVAGALVLLLSPLGLVLSAEAPHVVAILLGPKWAPSVPLVQVVSWMCLFAPLGFVGRSAMLAAGRVRMVFSLVLGATVVRTVLVVAAAHTGSLLMVIWADVTAIAVEGLLFTAYLLAHTDRRLGFLAGFVRVGLGLGVAALALRGLGLGWQTAPENATASALVQAAEAMAHLALSGGVASLLYAGTVGGLWWLSGRPAGPERLIGDVLVEIVPVLGKARRRAIPDDRPGA